MERPQPKVFDAERGFLCRDGHWTQQEADATFFSDMAGVVQICLRFGITSVILIIQNGGTRIEWPLYLS
jgi:hypothetical protein